MKIEDIKNAGLLELYILGDLSPLDMDHVEKAIREHPALKEELFEIEQSFLAYAQLNSVKVDPTQKPMLTATINYSDRILNGETPSFPPAINGDSKIVDYSAWLEKPYLQEPAEYEGMAGHIIGATEERKTLIIWLTEGAPPETHTTEIEKFLIVEGTCDITIGDNVHSLKAGDVLEIPLFISHHVEVTSSIRCKIILERSAA